MLPQTPADFPRVFAQAFAAHSAADIGALMRIDGQGLTLTGQWADTAVEMEAAWAADLAGTLSPARLVTGRSGLRMLGPGAAVLTQRYVVTGAVDANGTELPRFPAMLSALLIAGAEGWQAVTLSFSALSD